MNREKLTLVVVIMLQGWGFPHHSVGVEITEADEQEIRRLLDTAAEICLGVSTDKARPFKECERADSKLTLKIEAVGCGSAPLLQKIFDENRGQGDLNINYQRRSLLFRKIEGIIGGWELKCPEVPGIVEWLLETAGQSENGFVREEALDVAFRMSKDKKRIIPLYIDQLGDTDIGRKLPKGKAGEEGWEDVPIYAGAHATLQDMFARGVPGDINDPEDRKKIQEFWRKYWKKNKDKLVYDKEKWRFVKKRWWRKQ